MLITNFDTRKIFIWNNRSTTGTYTNGTGDPVTLTPGRLFGRITATNKVALQASGSSDGSQFPRFVLMSEHIVPAGVSVEVTLCISGDVAAEKLSFAAGDSLSKAVGTAGTIEDLLREAGINPVVGTEITGLDNQ